MLNGPYGKCMFDFMQNWQTVCQNYTIVPSCQLCMGVLFALHSCFHMGLSCVYSLIIWIGICGIFHLICISLVNVVHLFIYLFAIGMGFFLVKCSDLIAIFKNCVVCFLIFELWQFFVNSGYKSFILSSSHLWKRLYRMFGWIN